MVVTAFSMSWLLTNPAMEGVAAGEDVGAGQPHEGEARAVRAAADAAAHGRHAGPRIASTAFSTICGCRSSTTFMLRYCSLTVKV